MFVEMLDDVTKRLLIVFRPRQREIERAPHEFEFHMSSGDHTVISGTRRYGRSWQSRGAAIVERACSATLGDRMGSTGC